MILKYKVGVVQARAFFTSPSLKIAPINLAAIEDPAFIAKQVN